MTQAPPPPAGGQPKNEPLAIWCLVCGIASLVCCGLFSGIPAIILGNMARKKIAESGGTLGGETLAKVGGILGWIGTVLSVIAIIAQLIMLATGVGAGLMQ